MDTKLTDVHFQLSLFGDRIELATYNEIVRQMQIALQEQERAITGRDPHATWVLDTSAVIPVAASPNGTSDEALRQVIRATRDDFARAINPESVGGSRSARSQAAIQSILSQLGDDLQSIIVTGDDIEEVTVDQSDYRPRFLGHETEQPASPYVAGRHYEDISTVDGVVDLISMRGRTPYFSIREYSTGRHVTVYFDRSTMAQVSEALDRRVEVTGLVRFRGSGEVISVRQVSRIWWTEVEPLDILKYEGALPGLTHGMDEGDYIRELRSGDHSE